MLIDTERSAWLHTALTSFRNTFGKIALAIFKKERDIEPDPGGMRDEMEREFFARVSRHSP